MIQIQGNRLSPRNGTGRGHRRTRSANVKGQDPCGNGSMQSVTPTPSAQHGRFFIDPPRSSKPSSLAPSTLPPLDSPSSSSQATTCKGHPQRPPIRQSTLRLVAMVATALALVLCTRATVASPTASTNLRAGTTSAASQDRCATRIEKRRGLGIPSDREQCAAVLPAIVEGDSKWLVSVHVGRAPSATQQPGKRLRGAAQEARNLPHQYYVRAMEAALYSIAAAEPGAGVIVAVFSEGQWGGMVDENGVPVAWDVPGDICEELGLHCSQNLVLLNEPESLVSDSLECMATSDLLLASESKFSRAAAVLSDHVKVLTDRWEMDEDDLMVVLNPATTIAGMPQSQRKRLRGLIADYHECNPSRNSRLN